MYGERGSDCGDGKAMLDIFLGPGSVSTICAVVIAPHAFHLSARLAKVVVMVWPLALSRFSLGRHFFWVQTLTLLPASHLLNNSQGFCYLNMWLESRQVDPRYDAQ